MSQQDIAAAASFSAPQDPGGPFSEDQFLAVCHEVGTARARARPESSWQLLADSRGFSIYRVFDQKSGLYEYKLYGSIADCSPELCAEVYMDLNYRPNWDRYAKVYMSYFDDPGGMVPPWFVNWIAKTAVPKFLKDMKKACLRYHKKR